MNNEFDYDPNSPFFLELEETDCHSLFFQILMQEWNALSTLTPEQTHLLYAALGTALQSVECKMEACKVRGDFLHMIIEGSVNFSIDNILDALETAIVQTLLGFPLPGSWDVESVSGCDVINHVIFLA